MSIAWSSFRTEIEGLIAGTWPETRTVNSPAGGGIFRLSLAERENIDRIGTFPYAVYSYANPAPGDWGLNNSAFEVPVECHYVALNTEGEADRLAKLDLLRHAVLASGAT